MDARVRMIGSGDLFIFHGHPVESNHIHLGGRNKMRTSSNIDGKQARRN